MFKTKVPWGIVIALTALASTFSANIIISFGGVRTVLVFVVLGTFFANYRNDDCPFRVAFRRSMFQNKDIMLLLGWFYVVVVIAAIRGGAGMLVEWKLHAVSILALFYGFFLQNNPKFHRLSIYIAGVFLVHHALSANQFVSVTGKDMREALVEESAALGATDYWTEFAMLSILLACAVINERNKIVKVVGFFAVIFLYKTILLCGFATPVALFLIGHSFLGLAFLRFGKSGPFKVLIRLGCALALLAGSFGAIYKISIMEEDERFGSIQIRFKNMLEDPRGGGYDVDNSRFELTKISLGTFKQNPVFGCGGTYLNNPGSGGHHAFIDYMAIYGLLGGVPFIVFVVLCIMNSYRRCRQERDWLAFASFACAGIYFIVGLVNPGWLGGPMTALLLYALPYKSRPLPSKMQGGGLLKSRNPSVGEPVNVWLQR